MSDRPQIYIDDRAIPTIARMAASIQREGGPDHVAEKALTLYLRVVELTRDHNRGVMGLGAHERRMRSSGQRERAGDA
jgi:hypothetical protein